MVCQSLPLRKEARQDPCGTRRATSVESEGHVPPPQAEERRRLVCQTKVNLR